MLVGKELLLSENQLLKNELEISERCASTLNGERHKLREQFRAIEAEILDLRHQLNQADRLRAQESKQALEQLGACERAHLNELRLMEQELAKQTELTWQKQNALLDQQKKIAEKEFLCARLRQELEEVGGRQNLQCDQLAREKVAGQSFLLNEIKRLTEELLRSESCRVFEQNRLSEELSHVKKLLRDETTARDQRIHELEERMRERSSTAEKLADQMRMLNLHYSLASGKGPTMADLESLAFNLAEAKKQNSVLLQHKIKLEEELRTAVAQIDILAHREIGMAQNLKLYTNRMEELKIQNLDRACEGVMSLHAANQSETDLSFLQQRIKYLESEVDMWKAEAAICKDQVGLLTQDFLALRSYIEGLKNTAIGKLMISGPALEAKDKIERLLNNQQPIEKGDDCDRCRRDLQAEKRKREDDKKRFDEERRRLEMEKRKLEDDRKRWEEEKRRLEEQIRKLQQEKRRVFEQKRQLEETVQQMYRELEEERNQKLELVKEYRGWRSKVQRFQQLGSSNVRSSRLD